MLPKSKVNFKPCHLGVKAVRVGTWTVVTTLGVPLVNKIVRYTIVWWRTFISITCFGIPHPYSHPLSSENNLVFCFANQQKHVLLCWENDGRNLKMSSALYLSIVYTKTVDSVKRARWLARQTPNILHYLPPSNPGKNDVLANLRPLQVKKSSKLIFCGAYYLTVLLYTKTTIHLSVGG